ncbi:hypothetical protein SNOG_09847 [Parastagonospora nodorum SN15]|uniref:Uncharacterized protein n=1 Tax=Phaeosphaeria nodorum (strain SN15 / ATCC MYA-4574 / FGSC 10173) TaxID=321614 RepID=Q0UEG7_PHANO|nr:hypothetical protein SNOG_09847 [Parastagonospora nodorum SN15]EAT83112.1 hypothetical protein SNOG_09847 [Parastagonospora nodorum SN15]
MPLSAAVTILVFMTTSKWTYAPRKFSEQVAPE